MFSTLDDILWSNTPIIVHFFLLFSMYVGFPVVKVSILKSPKSAESGVTTLQFIQHRFCGGNAKSNKTHMVKNSDV